MNDLKNKDLIFFYDFLLVTLVAIFIENQIESDSLIHRKINQKLIMKNELADAKFVSPKFFVVIRQPNFGISKIVLQNVIAEFSTFFSNS
ncbi:hypothetical protein BpHYR1_006417 [Brachionus plicatilis]|uniref:Uncharacterized protein n=1 Tax=Brachionus plicatilis TaxID=10195 RepID=A0A3M7QJV8_BRAPC|nr:hypothetical protein BpHYR1_006417 [Brachionus plicatilis]